MRQKQLQSRLEQILREFVHLKTVTFSYRTDQGEIHRANNYTNIYIGFNSRNIKNIGWVSENIRGTAYVKNILCSQSNGSYSPKEWEMTWDKVQALILKYANTPLSKREDKYVIAIGKNFNGTLAVYSKDSQHVVNVPAKAVKRLDCYQFTDKDFKQLCENLPATFKSIARKGKIPLTKV